ncbi:hypothetical protein ACFXI8_26390 [Streptomyces niveus]|uniref:hypothetical protein n=1 Tax=Streptomyces niveus TaxID=193462 RepID=UPI0036C660D0
MITEAILFLVTAVILPMALTEIGDWCPRLAKNLVRWTARRLGDPQAIERYSEEWTRYLEEMPGKLAHMGFALGYLARLPLMRWSLRTARRASRSGQTVDQLAPTRTPIYEHFESTMIPRIYQSEALSALLPAILDGSRNRNRLHLLLGPPATGKTMAALWLGKTLAHAGKQVHYIWAPDWAHRMNPLFVSPLLRDRLVQATQGVGLLVVDEADDSTLDALEALRLPCPVLMISRNTFEAGTPDDLTRRPSNLGVVVDLRPPLLNGGYPQRGPGLPNLFPPVNGQL